MHVWRKVIGQTTVQKFGVSKRCIYINIPFKKIIIILVNPEKDVAYHYFHKNILKASCDTED